MNATKQEDRKGKGGLLEKGQKNHVIARRSKADAAIRSPYETVERRTDCHDRFENRSRKDVEI